MTDCLFCKIVRGEIGSHKIYEDQDAFAFLDIHPLTEGHCMVIPKRHYEKLEEMPKAEAGKLFEAVRIVAEKVQKAMNTTASTVGINNGKLAGQVVPHVHIHIIPRYASDGGGTIHSVVHSPTKHSLDEVREKIIKAF